MPELPGGRTSSTFALISFFVVVVEDRAGARTDACADSCRRQECRREDQADDRTANGSKCRSPAHVVRIVLHVDLAVGVAADEHEPVHDDHAVAGKLLDVVPVLLRSSRIGVCRDVQVNRHVKSLSPPR